MYHRPMVNTAAWLVALALLAFMVGCARAPLQETGNSDARSVYVIEPEIKGRGCLYTRVQQFGEGKSDVEVIVAQDGTSDWSLSRTFAFMGDAVTAAVTTIFGGGAGERTMQDIGKPDPLDGCSQLFEAPPVAAAPEPEVVTVVVEPAVEFTVDTDTDGVVPVPIPTEGEGGGLD